MCARVFIPYTTLLFHRSMQHVTQTRVDLYTCRNPQKSSHLKQLSSWKSGRKKILGNPRKTFKEGAFTLRKILFGPSQYLYLLSNTRVRFDNVYRRRLRNKRKFEVEKNRSTYVLYTITPSLDATSIGHFTRARPCGSHRLRRRCHNRFLVPVDRSRSLVASLPPPPPGAVYARFVQRCKRPLQSCPD